MKKIVNKINETGTLLVEAMAMLGLIAMVTPVLYKKASERTLELQDVNASSQLRALSMAVDSYLKDNFSRITKGETINGVNYSDFASNPDGATTAGISISHFSEYLPYGFLDDSNNPRETKLFTQDGYNVYIKSEADIYTDSGGEQKVRSQVLTGFVTAVPKSSNDIGQSRASRIASMVGSNGGYIQGDVAMGTQGIWSVSKSALDSSLADNTFVISSLQPIASQGLANEDILHRKDEPDADQELNTMETDLFMGFTHSNTRNIRMVNQIIMHPNTARMVGGSDATSHDEAESNLIAPLDGNTGLNNLDRALYIGSGGGAYLEGALRAANSLFEATSEGIKFFGTNTTTSLDPEGNEVSTTSRNSEATFSADASKMVYGNPGTGNAKFTIDSNQGKLSFISSSIPASGSTPAQSGRDMLNVGKDHFAAANKSLFVGQENNVWYTAISSDGDVTPRVSTATIYDWSNGYPEEKDNIDRTPYALSVNGSAFVRDTLLTGKMKSYNVDAATLRAGVNPADFDEFREDGKFYLTVKRDYDKIGGGLFRAGSKESAITVAEEKVKYGENALYPGITVVTDEKRGIDIAVGDVPLIGYDGNGDIIPDGPVGMTEDGSYIYAPKEGEVRIGALNGISLSTLYDQDGNINRKVPVSIQNDMLRAYADEAELSVVDSITNEFNIISTRLERGDGTNQGRHEISDMEVSINAYKYNDELIPYDAREVVNINPEKIGATEKNEENKNLEIPTSRFAGAFAIYDHDYEHDGGKFKDLSINNAAFSVRKGAVEIRSTTTDEVKDVKNQEKILVVDNNKDEIAIPDSGEEHGTVYIRKGSINLATNNDARLSNADIEATYLNSGDKKPEQLAKGYIAADRFISHFYEKEPEKIFGATHHEGKEMTNGKGGKYVLYDRFEVNPAYTSVMHDIKLTTRGGARLSDILPDFINKGIYVVDNTYDPELNWANAGKIEIETIGTEWPSKYDISSASTSMETEVSAYTGFVPTPKCPNGYAKVITLTPAGWAMAQAGTPYYNKKGIIDIAQHTNPDEYIKALNDPKVDINDYKHPTYQKNTWLRSMVLPHCGSKLGFGCNNSEDFHGWGTVMGFIYPKAYYQDIEKNITANEHNIKDSVYWNLFPVYYKQIEGYATVYCYFDRGRKDFYDENYVDVHYNQLQALSNGSINDYNKGDRETGALYIKRLDDPNLKYNSPW